MKKHSLNFKINSDNLAGICFCGFFTVISSIANFVMPDDIYSYLGAIIHILCVICFICFIIVLLRLFDFCNILKILISIISSYAFFQFMGNRVHFNIETFIYLVICIVIIGCMFQVSKPIINIILLFLLITPYIFIDLIMNNLKINFNNGFIFILYMCIVRYVYPKLCILVNKVAFKVVNDENGLREIYKLAYLLFSILFMMVYQSKLDGFSRTTVLLLAVYLIFDIKWEIFINKNEENKV